VLDRGAGWKIKRIEVKPGSRLSYQTHAQRSEHWAVVVGTATCTLDGETVVVHAGESVDVPVGTAHRIANLHDDELVLIEVPITVRVEPRPRGAGIGTRFGHLGLRFTRWRYRRAARGEQQYRGHGQAGLQRAFHGPLLSASAFRMMRVR
jgi:hypothetical protein